MKGLATKMLVAKVIMCDLCLLSFRGGLYAVHTLKYFMHTGLVFSQTVFCIDYFLYKHQAKMLYTEADVLNAFFAFNCSGEHLLTVQKQVSGCLAVQILGL